MASKQTYEDLVELGREAVNRQENSFWEIGDLSLKAVPFAGHGAAGEMGASRTWRQEDSPLRRWARDIGWDGTMTRLYILRATSAKWPKNKREPGASHAAHSALNAHKDRFAAMHPGMTTREAARLQGHRTAPEPRNRDLNVRDGIKRAQAAASFLRSAAKVDYDDASEEQLEAYGAALQEAQDELDNALEAAGMADELYIA
jgi:hypothetical protein